MNRLCKWSKPRFNAEVKEVIRVNNRNRRRWQKHRSQKTWEAYQELRNNKGRAIAKCLRQTHRDKVEKVAGDAKRLWKLAKWAKNRTTARFVYTPVLQHPEPDQGLVDKPEGKVELLKQTFFPIPPEADLADIEEYQYLTPLLMSNIIEKKFRTVIFAASPNKTSGLDGISNRIFHLSLDLLIFFFQPLFNAYLEEGRYLEAFKNSITVVLRKPNKRDYTVAKAYRPVALFNTIGKAMESIITRRISYLAEIYGLLPETYLGGRKITSTKYAVHILLEQIYGI